MQKDPIPLTRLLKIAEGTGPELQGFDRAGWRSSSQHTMELNTEKSAVITEKQMQKSLVISDEAFEDGRGGEIRPGWRSSSQHAIALNTAKPAVITKTQIQKSLVISDEAFENGRGGEIRTPNTRIWNPLLCQLELHPCSSCLTRRHSNKVAERTGLEPATPGVTGRYSNQLNYRSTRR